MSTTRVPLSEQEEAHVALILACHTDALAEATRQHDLAVSIAEKMKEERFGPIVRAHKIPPKTSVSVLGRLADAPAFLVFEAPDIAPTVADGISQVSVKSTDAVQASGA